jgi:hypothetical protein
VYHLPHYCCSWNCTPSIVSIEKQRLSLSIGRRHGSRVGDVLYCTTSEAVFRTRTNSKPNRRHPRSVHVSASMPHIIMDTPPTSGFVICRRRLRDSASEKLEIKKGVISGELSQGPTDPPACFPSFAPVGLQGSGWRPGRSPSCPFQQFRVYITTTAYSYLSKQDLLARERWIWKECI